MELPLLLTTQHQLLPSCATLLVIRATPLGVRVSSMSWHRVKVGRQQGSRPPEVAKTLRVNVVLGGTMRLRRQMTDPGSDQMILPGWLPMPLTENRQPNLVLTMQTRVTIR
jgi:hypothetical protein